LWERKKQAYQTAEGKKEKGVSELHDWGGKEKEGKIKAKKGEVIKNRLRT